MSEPKPRIHLNHLDGLRALAAVYVTIFHAKCMVWPMDNTPLGELRKFVSWSMYGHWSVCIFIVLSGYCLMLPVVNSPDITLRGGLVGFMKRRARRILPPYYFALILSLLLIWTSIGSVTGTAWDRSLPVTFHSIISHLTLTHNLFFFKDQSINDYSQINYPFWSVAVEWQIYFTFPILLLMWRRLGGLWATTLWTLISYMFVFLFRPSQLIGITPQFYALFGLGALGAAISVSPSALWEKARARVPWLAVTIGSALAVLALRNMKNGRILDFLVGLSTLCLLVLLSQPAGERLRAICSARPLVSIGSYSYSLYLLHAPLLQLLWQFGISRLHTSDVSRYLLIILLGVPFCLGCSYLFYLVCERPFLTARRQSA